MRPLIYIAGPFRADTPWEIEQNIRRAEAHGLRIAQLGGIPVIPHAMYRFFDKALPDAFWLEAGITLLHTCDAVAVCVDAERAQESKGTAGEIVEAFRGSLPVWYGDSLEALPEWIEGFTKGCEESST